MNTGYPVRYTDSKSIQHHVQLINEMTVKSVNDPEIRRLAVRIVSSNYVWRVNPRTGQSQPYIRGWKGHYFETGGDMGPCEPHDGECELARIWNFVLANFRYTYDPEEVDTFATARLSLEDGGGDCDDATILLGALLKSVGFSVQARVISVAADPDNWVHIYPMVGLPKDDPTEWVALDCTVSGYYPGDEYPDIGKILDTPV